MRHASWKVATALLLAAVFLLLLGGMALAAPPWSDAPNSFWVHTYGVTDQQVCPVAGGYADGSFRPNQPVTRAEFAKMAVSGLGLPTQNPASPTFMDVLPGSTFYTYIEGAYAAGLVKGVTTPAGRFFLPDADISRQQTNSILGRYLSDEELEVTGGITGVFGGETPGTLYPSLEDWYVSEGVGQLTRFSDAAEVLPAHRADSAYLIFRDVVKGSEGMLDPEAKLSRAQAAALVLRLKGVTFVPTPPVIFGLDPRSGPVAGGTTVVISGNSFTGAIAVTFGGTNATSFHVDSATQITAVAPAHAAGMVDVLVTTPHGESADTGSDDYTYVASTSASIVQLLERNLYHPAGPQSYVWFPSLFGDQVAFIDIPEIHGVFLSDFPSEVPLKLVAASSANAPEVEVAKLSRPDFGNGAYTWECWRLWTIPGLPEAEVPASLLWSTIDPVTDPAAIDWFLYDGLTGMTEAGEPHVVLPKEDLIRMPFQTGDFLALPLTSPAFEKSHPEASDTSIGEHLLLLSRADASPVEVDPSTPQLAAHDLGTLSPYVSWYGFYLKERYYFGASLPSGPPQVYDLRSGKAVEIEWPQSTLGQDITDVVVSGKWLASATCVFPPRSSAPARQSIYLTDLETGGTRQVYTQSEPSTQISNLALTRDWLLWVDSAAGDLVGLHLPDLEPVRVGVLVPGETGRPVKVAAAGDLALVDVRFPGYDPPFMSISNVNPGVVRVVKLR